MWFLPGLWFLPPLWFFLGELVVFAAFVVFLGELVVFAVFVVFDVFVVFLGELVVFAVFVVFDVFVVFCRACGFLGELVDLRSTVVINGKPQRDLTTESSLC